MASRDAKSDVSQQRIKHYIQRVVRTVGNLPKSQNTELMTGQLLRLATSLMASYQACVADGSDVRLKMGLVDQQAGELLYWLGLLRDSKASEDPEIPMLWAEGNVIRQVFTDAMKNSTRK
jgi:four helix bundle protein